MSTRFSVTITTVQPFDGFKSELFVLFRVVALLSVFTYREFNWKLHANLIIALCVLFTFD